MDKSKVDIITDERIIFELIINNEKVFPYLKNIIKLTSNFFYSESARNTYNVIDLLYRKYGDIYGALRLSSKSIDKQISEFLLELKSDTTMNQIDTKRILNDAIVGIELKKVEHEINEITQNQKGIKYAKLDTFMNISELQQRRRYLIDNLNADYNLKFNPEVKNG